MYRKNKRWDGLRELFEIKRTKKCDSINVLCGPCWDNGGNLLNWFKVILRTCYFFMFDNGFMVIQENVLTCYYRNVYSCLGENVMFLKYFSQKMKQWKNVVIFS